MRVWLRSAQGLARGGRSKGLCPVSEFLQKFLRELLRGLPGTGQGCQGPEEGRGKFPGTGEEEPCPVGSPVDRAQQRVPGARHRVPHPNDGAWENGIKFADLDHRARWTFLQNRCS